MNQAEARAFIVDQLGKEQNRDDILLILCNELNIDWEQAEQMVRDAESFDGREITRRRSSILIALGLGVILGGLGIITYGFWYLWEVIQMDLMQQFMYSQYFYGVGAIMVTGLAMITGGIIGFRKVLSELFN